MCLALPGKIEKINGENAIIDYGGIKKEANVSFIECKIGDYVLVHVGFAIEVVDKKQAEGMYNLLYDEE
ncbi:MAG: HypC/HybG/HupF family hydrogenase formation chaperone [Candidatus Woesearchaeota archaeon]|jgi:hydrogenase expression/formation protein HypC|nr:HypC/HybG/HupF family hydrogenase formation chaperone [Candidatus Woesearchaeota archaeon]